MFRPQEMSQVRLMTPEPYVVQVTEALAASGVFQPAPAERWEAEAVPHFAEQWSGQAASFDALEQRILALMRTLHIEEGEPPDLAPSLVEPEIAQLEAERIEREVQAYVEELDSETHRLEELQRYVAQLELVAELNVDLEALRKMRYAYVLMGTLPVINLERLRSSLEGLPTVLLTLKEEQYLATVVLIGVSRDAEVINRAARSAYLSPIKIPEAYRGTPAEAIQALQAGIERAKEHIAECQQTVARLQGANAQRLRRLFWRVRASRILAETMARYRRMRYTYLITGWVPSSNVSQLRDRIAAISDKITFEVYVPPRSGDVEAPVALHNPPIIRAFQSLVTNYAYPRYGELDPTPLIALTFPLIFGMMFGDVGHGFLLVVVGLLLALGVFQRLRKFSTLGTIIAVCGVASIGFGVLFGSVFGFEGQEGLIQPRWEDPLTESIDVLLTAVGAGVVVISVGMIANIANMAISRRWGRLIFSHNGLCNMVFYWALFLLAARFVARIFAVNPWILRAVAAVPAGVWGLAAAICGVCVMFGELLGNLVDGRRPLFEESLGTYLMQAFFELFEVLIGLLSNTLSYIRIGAFAIAHGALGLAVHQLAAIGRAMGGAAVYWIILVLGNLFVVGFEGLIVGIQTLRLEYYEFFSKFFSGGGKGYTPLSLTPKE